MGLLRLQLHRETRWRAETASAASESFLMAKRMPYAPPAPAKAVKPVNLPHPHRNLGQHLKQPKDGEIVTEHHRGAKK